jgi:hypothetical protein
MSSPWELGTAACVSLGLTNVRGKRPPLELALQKRKVKLIRSRILKPHSSLLSETKTLVWWHELIKDLISRLLAILHLYEKDDDFGSKDKRSGSHSEHKKIEMWQIGFSSTAMACIYNPEGTTVDLPKAKQSESVMERNHRSEDRGDSLRTTIRRCNRFKICSIIMIPRIPKNCYKRIISKTD